MRHRRLWMHPALIILMVASLFLSGCSPYKSGFNCPVPEGMPCTSMSRINEMIDQGLLPRKESLDDKDTCTSCSKQPKLAHKRSAKETPQWVEVVMLKGTDSEPLHQRYVVEAPDDRGAPC